MIHYPLRPETGRTACGIPMGDDPATSPSVMDVTCRQCLETCSENMRGAFDRMSDALDSSYDCIRLLEFLIDRLDSRSATP